MKKIKQFFCWHKWQIWKHVKPELVGLGDIRFCPKCHKIQQEFKFRRPDPNQRQYGGYQPGGMINLYKWVTPKQGQMIKIRAHEYEKLNETKT